ncbi:MAG: hypothetical protein ACOC2Q_05990 [Spirochaetota bacterium]
MKEWLKTRIDRYREFHANPEPGQILGLFSRWTFPVPNSELGLPGYPNDHWDWENDPVPQVDHAVRSLRAYLDHTSDLDHDWIPQFSVGGGTGLYGAYMTDADITFTEETSWAEESIRDWSDLDSLKVGEENRWTRSIRKMVARGVELCEGDYVASTIAHFAPSDMANAARGNQLFFDLYDSPEELRRLLDLCADSTVWLQRELRKIAPLVAGSDASRPGSAGAGIWMPGEAPFMSEDAADLCSPEAYAEFFRTATQRILDNLGGAVIHHHVIGSAVHPEIAKLHGLSALQISEDPNRPSPIHLSEELVEAHPIELPLIVECEAPEVESFLDVLARGRAVLQIRIRNKDEGRDVMKLIRSRSRLG